MVYGAHESREDLLDFQQNWTFYFFGPEIVSVVYFPLEGLSRLPQDPHVASSSLAQDLASVQDRHGAEVGEEEGSMRAWTYWLLGGGRRLVPSIHEFPQTLARF